jgi:large subunit ribosomal protein L23
MTATFIRKKKTILAPLITFKSTQLAQRKCYTFQVRPDASKDEISQEFKEIFKGKVLKINTVADRTHKRKTKKGYARKADGKKAYIYSDIDLDIFPKLEV